MARDRARSSFTVEVRRGRSTPIETDPKRALWRGLDLAGEAARHEMVAHAAAPAAPARDPFVARAAVIAPRREAPRILPSLIQAPALVEEPAPTPEPEERLPRVRRARRPRPERPASEPSLAGPDPDEVFDDAPDEPDLEDDATEPRAGSTSSDLRLRRRQPRVERVLRAGERWKRRLPRALW